MVSKRSLSFKGEMAPQRRAYRRAYEITVENTTVYDTDDILLAIEAAFAYRCKTKSVYAAKSGNYAYLVRYWAGGEPICGERYGRSVIIKIKRPYALGADVIETLSNLTSQSLPDSIMAKLAHVLYRTTSSEGTRFSSPTTDPFARDHDKATLAIWRKHLTVQIGKEANHDGTRLYDTERLKHFIASSKRNFGRLQHYHKQCSDFYQRLEQMCKRTGVNPQDVAQAFGLPPLSEPWKTYPDTKVIDRLQAEDLFGAEKGAAS